MSLDQAKTTLGFRPGESPSPDEVNKAWRSLAFKNHPDRGGDPQKMVELNVAKDVLTGKMKSDYSAPKQPSSENDWKYAGPGEKPEVVIPGVPFSKLKIPTGVNWLASSIKLLDFKLSLGEIIVLVGKTSSDQAIVSAFLRRGEYTTREEKSAPLTQFETTWSSSTKTLTKEASVKKVRAAMTAALADLPTEGNIRLAKGWLWDSGQPTEANLIHPKKGKDVGLNDLLAYVGFDAGNAKPKPAKVEIDWVFKKKNWAPPSKDPFGEYDQFLRVNGKETRLSDATTDNLFKSGLPAVLQWKVRWTKTMVINLNKLRGGASGGYKEVLQIMWSCLTSEPPQLKTTLREVISTLK
jgi:hypothetical protein